MFSPVSAVHLIQESRRLAGAVLARRTTETYASNWCRFTQWCSLHGRQPLPASSESIELFLTQSLATRKVKTVRSYLAAILHHCVKHEYPLPDTARARAILAGAQRLRGERPVQKSAISPDQLREMIRRISLPDPWLTRDRAVLLFGFTTALRRISITDARPEHLRFTPQGMIVHVPREKQDQTGAGRDIGIPFGRDTELCAVRAMQDWLRLRGPGPGYLFDGLKNGVFRPQNRMHHNTIAVIVKRAVRSVGLDPARYAGHSLRAGFITTALEAGAGEILTARHTGHRSLEVLRMYMRPQDPFRGNACSLIL
jgi:integrase